MVNRQDKLSFNRTCRFLLWVSFCLPIARTAASEPSEHLPANTSTRIDADVPPVQNGFRLGTAARPLGWATAIGDFDADGNPDFAIADRPDSTAPVEIDVELSSGRTDRLTLAASSDAVTVVAEDIDNDNDLDIVVTRVLTRDVLAVFLNDGTGRFTAANPRTFASSLRPIQVIRSAVSAGIGDAVIVPRRLPLNCSQPGPIAANIRVSGRIPCSEGPSGSIAVNSVGVPRGPPSSL